MSTAMKLDGKLEVFQNGQLLQEFSLHDSDVWLGRDEACLIRLDDRAISRKHALIRSIDGGFEFENKSKFGWAKLNGQETTQAMLKEGDRLELGPYEILVKLSQIEAKNNGTTAGPLATAAIDLSQAAAAPAFVVEPEIPAGVEAISLNEPVSSSYNEVPVEAPAPEIHTSANIDIGQVQADAVTKVFNVPEKVKAILQFRDGAANVTQYEMGDSEIAIGRSQQCHIVLEDKKSSRKNTIIKRSGTTYLIKDLDSANGTLVNGTPITEQELQSGDEIQIGETSFTFQLVQADYEVKKEAFIQVPPQESMQVAAPMSFHDSQANAYQPEVNTFQPVANPFPGQMPPPPQPGQFEIPTETKKSLIGKYLDRYRAMNTKQQIIYGAVILMGIWYMMDDDSPQTKAKLLNGQQKKVAQVKKDAKKPGGGQAFESLTPEQQRYIDTQYQLAFDLYKNRDYDKSLLEISKIFSLVQDYKNAREIEAFAREGKRKLEAQEEERKRKEAERQAQLKLQSLIEQAGLYMDKKQYKEAEALFPEIELIQPENAAVSEWRKKIMANAEAVEKEKEIARNQEVIIKQAWADYKAGIELENAKKYLAAIDQFYEVLDRNPRDSKLVKSLKEEIQKSEDQITATRDPLIAQAKQLEQDSKLPEAYKAYEKASEIDPDDETAPAGMKRIRGTLTAHSRYLYTEGVFAESYSDYETAEKRYREVLESTPKDDDYYAKAENRLKKLTVYKKPGGESAQ